MRGMTFRRGARLDPGQVRDVRVRVVYPSQGGAGGLHRVQVLGQIGQIPVAAVVHPQPGHLVLGPVIDDPRHGGDIDQGFQGMTLPTLPGGNRVDLHDRALITRYDPEHFVGAG